MSEYENMVRSDIERKYGSIPKMASLIGVAPTTIYHALERGLENTTVKTRRAILEPLYGKDSLEVNYIEGVGSEQADGEHELLSLFRSMDEQGRAALLTMARALARK